jgi:hypothetical protein
MSYPCPSCGVPAPVRDVERRIVQSVPVNRRRLQCPTCRLTFNTIEIAPNPAYALSADKPGYRLLSLCLQLAEVFGGVYNSPSLKRRLEFSDTSSRNPVGISDSSSSIRKFMGFAKTVDRASRSSKSGSAASDEPCESPARTSRSSAPSTPDTPSS